MFRSGRNAHNIGRWSPRPAEWNKCNLCGERFSNWPELRDHKSKHTQEEIDRGLKLKRQAGRSKSP